MTNSLYHNLMVLLPFYSSFSDHVLIFVANYTTNCICQRQTISILCKLCLEASHDNFFELIYLHHWLPTQYHHFCALFTNNIILISFDHSPCNLKSIIFLIILPVNVSKSFPFCLTLGLVCLFLCFSKLVFFLFPLLL